MRDIQPRRYSLQILGLPLVTPGFAINGLQPQEMKMRLSAIALMALSLLAFVGCQTTSANGDAAGEHWWQGAESEPTRSATAGLSHREPSTPLEIVLGNGADQAWQALSRPGDSAVSVARDEQLGAPVITVPMGQTVTLDGRTRYTSNVEVQARLRLPTATTTPATAVLHLARPDETAAGLAVNLSASNNQIRVTVTYAGEPLHDATALAETSDWKTPQVFNGWTWDLRAYTNILPGWPEDYRRHIEHDMGTLPEQNVKWLDVRVQLTDGGIAVWLDDHMIAWAEDPKLVTEGLAQIVLNQGVQLARWSVTPLDETPGFLPVPLAGYANATIFVNGAAVDRASLPPTGKSVRVRGVPFVFSDVNSEGHDHIDVGRSLYRHANDHGYLPANTYRWGGSTLRDPARIQLRLPNKQYDTLYVIAASDDEPDCVPKLSAMFYRPNSGFAKTFTEGVPLATAEARTEALPVKLTNGKSANLWLVKIPLDPGQLSSFADIDIVEIELTKQVELFRSYPDPISYSYHQAGRPSAVHVYALTLAEAPVGFTFEPTVFGHTWTQPQVPAYISTLTNHMSATQQGTLEITTRSYDGAETTTQTSPVTVEPGQSTNVELPVKVKLYGIHEVNATLKIAERTWVEQRSLCHLAPDERPTKWTEGEGTLFGYWSFHGDHYTPKAELSAPLMTLAGARTTSWIPDSILDADFVRKHWSAPTGSAWHLSSQPPPTGLGYEVPPQWTAEDELDPAKVQKFQDDLVASWTAQQERFAPGLKPKYLFFYPEPHLSMRLSAGNIPEYWNGEPYALTEHEEKRVKMYFNTAKIAAEAAREHFPDLKILIPWGDPGFVWPLLRAGFPKELIDGSGLDNPGFERLPEMQLHQVALHRLYTTRKEYERAGIPNPELPYCEGTFVPTEPGACTYREQMDLYHRWVLISLAYGVKEIYSGWFDFDNGDYFGAEHYGGCGIRRRIPYCDPKPGYAAFATMTDKLAAANFEGWMPTGSLTTFCLRFKGPKGYVYALWTIRGKRPVTLTLTADLAMNVTDSMNNTTVVTSRDKQVTVTTGASVVYVTGGEIASLQLGKPDHSDVAPPDGSLEVADLGDGTWQYTSEQKKYFETNTFAVFPYLGRFSGEIADDADHGQVLESKLEKQDVVREVMPWYNTLTPANPVPIKGVPSHLGVWVKGASDWGRVIYVLRDAAGERWTSIGHPDQWNCDDVHSWSSFNFDGWRYVRFELPGHVGYDNFRKHGTTWWRADDGDTIVDLPLALEQIIIEQRSHVIYVNDVQPAASDTVRLGRVYAEYETPDDKTDEAVRINRLRMKLPEGMPDLPNPIAELAESGLGEPTRIIKLVPPNNHADGTRAHVHFEPVEGAAKYFIWCSAYPHGTGAVNLTPAGATNGALMHGMRPEIKLFYFVIWEDANGQKSLPSTAHEQVLIDQFKEK